MSFNPDPRFVPTPGRPTAAPRPDFYVDGYGCWKSHRTMAEAMAEEAPALCGKCRQTRSTSCAYSGCPLSDREAA